MNFIVINGSVDQTREELEGTRRLLSKVIKDTNKEEYRIKLNVVESKLKALDRYEHLQSKKSEFYKLKKRKFIDPAYYVKKCKSLCKDIKGIYYSERDNGFIVKKTINGNTYYGGVFDDLDDAMESLDNLLETHKK